MFEEFLDIPAHPLLVHGAVVFVPLQVIAAIAYGLLPIARRNIAWLVLTLAVVAPVAALVTKLSGDAFRARLIRNGTSDPGVLADITEHQGYGNNTAWAAGALGVLMIVLVVLRTRGRTPAADRSTAESGAATPLLVWVVTGVTIAAGVVATIYVVLAGDTGAHMAWTGM